MEDALVTAGDGYLNDVLAELRHRGVGETELAADRTAAVLAMAEAMQRHAAALQQSACLPMQ